MLSGVRAFIQARMSSRRFPGKVLAPFRGRPLVLHTLESAARVLGPGQVTLVTSGAASDDPLAIYLRAQGIDVVRGPLDDVFERFRLALAERPSAWVVRLCADSPLLDPGVVRRVLDAVRPGADIVTNVYPTRTFPGGQSVEVLRAARLLEIDAARLTPHDREHVTPFYYRNPGEFEIVSVEAERPCSPGERVTVDTIEDLQRLEGGAAP